MAKFEIAESITGRNEGGYANNPADTGGETYAGIARNHWGKWEGWKYIDPLKIQYKTYKQNFKNTDGRSAMPLASYINYYAGQDDRVKKSISKFYKQNFWDVMKLDLVNDQQLANSVYDFGVNSGTGRSAKFLQQSVNVVCNVGLVVDGKIGAKTLNEINKHNAELIYNSLNKNREDFYRSIAKGSQAQFLKSWLSRLKPYKK